MRQRIQAIRERFTEFWNRMNKRSRTIATVFAVLMPLAVIASILYLVLHASSPKMEMLYTHLETKDAGVVVEELKKTGTEYELQDDGTTILVNKKDVADTRIRLASKGLPAGGTSGYELFDATKLGVTDFSQKINRIRALQGELTRTIQGLGPIEEARVMIVQPEASLFITEQKRPSASVFVKLKSGSKLNDEQVRGIMYLVSASLEGMQPSDVKIVDSNGRLLSDIERRKDEGARMRMSEWQLKQKIEIEERYCEIAARRLSQGALALDGVRP